MSGLTVGIARLFARQELRLAQAGMSGTFAARAQSGIVFLTAMVLSMTGVGVSVFSVKQLKQGESLQPSTFRNLRDAFRDK